MLAKHKHYEDEAATETTLTSTKTTNNDIYKLHLLNGKYSATLLFKENELRNQDNVSVFDFFDTYMNDAILNIVSLTEEEESKIDKEQAFQCVEIFDNKELSSTILTIDAFQKLSMKDLVSLIDSTKREIKIRFYLEDKRGKGNTWAER